MTSLTAQQWRIVYLVACGFSTAQIAASLRIRPGTARNHLTRIFSRLGLGSRHQLAVVAFAHGWVCADVIAAGLAADARQLRAINRGLAARCRGGNDG
jgi:DNA-binding CsgD family transcriptional regulator